MAFVNITGAFPYGLAGELNNKSASRPISSTEQELRSGATYIDIDFSVTPTVIGSTYEVFKIDPTEGIFIVERVDLVVLRKETVGTTATVDIGYGPASTGAIDATASVAYDPAWTTASPYFITTTLATSTAQSTWHNDTAVGTASTINVAVVGTDAPIAMPASTRTIQLLANTAACSTGKIRLIVHYTYCGKA